MRPSGSRPTTTRPRPRRGIEWSRPSGPQWGTSPWRRSGPRRTATARGRSGAWCGRGDRARDGVRRHRGRRSRACGGVRPRRSDSGGLQHNRGRSGAWHGRGDRGHSGVGRCRGGRGCGRLYDMARPWRGMTLPRLSGLHRTSTWRGHAAGLPPPQRRQKPLPPDAGGNGPLRWRHDGQIDASRITNDDM